jgi:hypothetical protein
MTKNDIPKYTKRREDPESRRKRDERALRRIEALENKQAIPGKYVVDNVTFCSEANKYPHSSRDARLTLNHTPASGDVVVARNGDVTMRMDIATGSSLLEALLRETSLVRRRRDLEFPLKCPCAYLETTLKKNEYSTYGHEDRERLTFVFQMPNRFTPDCNCLYKIHTSRVQLRLGGKK